MKITGKVFKIFDTQRISDTFSKREFVLEYADNPMYPQLCIFQCVGKNLGILDTIKPSQSVEVSFNLRGREWIAPSGEKRYFNSLEAWKVTPVVGTDETMEVQQNQKTKEKDPEVTLAELEDGDDLPF